MWCIINLPNGTQQAVKWDSKAIGQDCLEKVCKALGICCEMEYFGLEHWVPNQPESRTRQWINLRNRLSCDGSSGIHQLMLALRVKFWVPVHFLLQENVRNLFYMQAKVDLLEGRLNARDWENAAKLAALLCQADGIRFNEQSLKARSSIAMKKACDLLNSQMAAQKEKKEKEYVLSFKKPRLSKHKSVENIENVPAETHTTPQLSKRSASLDSSGASLSSHIANNTNLTEQSCDPFEKNSTVSLLCAYQDYIVRPASDIGTPLPDDFLQQIASEHKKLSQLKISPKSAKYWLLREIQDLPGYGEEVFSGENSENSLCCDVSVGADGITVCTGDEKNKIPFSAIASAKSFRRSFKLEYVDDHNERKDLEIKLTKHAYAAGLYRSITERHAFYVCDKVRGVVTNQFVRDLKGTIASMFKEDTELGKRYVFDIQHTCREVHDQARRTLHERGIEITTYSPSTDSFEEVSPVLPKLSEEASCSRTSYSISLSSKLDQALREREEREAVIERCVDTRISEAMTCKICMDRAINTMFNPCSHVMACAECAARCINCPNCRVKVTSVVKIYLPPELRKCQAGLSGAGSSLSETSQKPTKCT